MQSAQLSCKISSQQVAEHAQYLNCQSTNTSASRLTHSKSMRDPLSSQIPLRRVLSARDQEGFGMAVTELRKMVYEDRNYGKPSPCQQKALELASLAEETNRCEILTQAWISAAGHHMSDTSDPVQYVKLDTKLAEEQLPKVTASLKRAMNSTVHMRGGIGTEQATRRNMAWADIESAKAQVQYLHCHGEVTTNERQVTFKFFLKPIQRLEAALDTLKSCGNPNNSKLQVELHERLANATMILGTYLSSGATIFYFNHCLIDGMETIRGIQGVKGRYSEDVRYSLGLNLPYAKKCFDYAVRSLNTALRFCKEEEKLGLEIKKLSVLLRRTWRSTHTTFEPTSLRIFFFSKTYKRLFDQAMSDKNQSLDHARNLLKLAYLARQFQKINNPYRCKYPQNLENMIPRKLAKNLVAQAKPLIEHNQQAAMKDRHLATSWTWESYDDDGSYAIDVCEFDQAWHSPMLATTRWPTNDSSILAQLPKPRLLFDSSKNESSNALNLLPAKVKASYKTVHPWKPSYQ